jgi:RNA polymerase sigma-70 factor (ECF subfamily)
MNRVDDHSLVRQSLQGDAKAFEEIVDRYHRPIYSAAFRILNDTDDAEEITQSVFVKAFEKLHTFSFDLLLFNWLYRIAINEALNASQRREHFVPYDEEVQRPGTRGGDEYETKEIGAIIDGALKKLTLDYRTVVVLYHFQHLTYSEMSYILGVPEKTIKSRLFTARNLLRELLQKAM